jgi:ABC-type uncharacterized transport system substrate-binding protein
MKRREFINLLGGAAIAWPVAARAQQHQVMPVIGFLSTGSPDESAVVVDELRKGLRDTGLIENYNVAIEFRRAERQLDRLPVLAAELVNRPVAVLFAVDNAAALAAKAAAATIPIVFAIGGDPVRLGLVSSFDRPGGNITGVTATSRGLESKRVELLHQLADKATDIAMLINPRNPASDTQSQEGLSAARTLGLQLHILRASNDSELETAFVTLVQLRAGALLIPNDAFFNSRFRQLVALAAQHSMPALYPWREYAEAGGLMSYGTNLRVGLRDATIYLGKILRGAKPADLPVLQPTKFELIINVETAKALGLTVPRSLLVSATQIIQ